MIRFINIENNNLYEFENWEEIMSRGGLKNCLPTNEWKDIWNEDAAYENNGMAFLGKNLHGIDDSIKAYLLFKQLQNS